MDLIFAHIPHLPLRKFYASDIVILFKICYYCALRINEALKLTVEDFNIQEREVYLGTTKTGRNESASIHPIFIDDLDQYLRGKKGALFPEMKYPIVYHWLKKIGETLNIPALTAERSETGEDTVTHIFRKSFAKDLFYGNLDGRKAPMNVISQKLRHKGKNANAQTWQYLKLSTEDVKEWEAMNEL